MQYQHYDLGMKDGGETVIVTLTGNAANVKLLDYSNFQAYRNGRSHNYRGGYFTHSPAKINIPTSGHWYVTVDLGGQSGRLGSSVQIVK